MLLIITTIITTFFLLSSSSSSHPQQNLSCIRVCGTHDKSTQTRVQYPFGFSPGCEIQLNCSENFSVKIGDFNVQNITNENILVNIPAECDRPIGKIRQLFGTHYAPTWRNNFLLHNCSKPRKRCLIEPGLLEDRFEVKACQSGNRSCYLEEDRSLHFTSFDSLEGTGCSTLFTSIAVENRSVNSSVELEIQTVELGWWSNGTCNCVALADCTNLNLGGLPGFRCRCKTGFEGDGFVDGGGCRKVSDCSASRYMSGRCGGTTKVGILIGGIAAGAGLVAALALIYYCIRKRTSHLKNQLSAKRLINEATGSSTVPLFPYKDVEKATHGFSEKHRLGTGAYGTVYAGKLYNDEWVAIKKLRRRDADGIDQIMNEIKLLSSIGKGRVDDMIDPFLEPNRDAWTLSSIHKVAELAFRCLAFHKDMRPSMTEVAEELEQVRLSGWAPLDENIGMGSSVSSSCASPFNGSEQSLGITNAKKAGIGSRRVIVTQREVACLSTMEEVSDSSPVSVHDPWLSHQSSPSTNSLLGNITH
ncbi:hypothetical protein AG4045_029431 [Apium graveolens]|uniref:Protein kinase domain-containing protein n=1 Tax=Apium graveolens TaxID=4045 RepID=A0A6L5BA84_APIGR|nr:hypothetical protein AG4045_029431 [Apium graveolens]